MAVQFAQPSDMQLRFRARAVADLCSDKPGDWTDATVFVTPAPQVTMALQTASAEILTAALTAEKYALSDIQNLAASGDAFLIDLTCNLALGRLLLRASLGTNYPEFATIVEEARRWLALLRLGERIFAIQSAGDAGQPDVVLVDNVQASQIGLAAYLFTPDYLPRPDGPNYRTGAPGNGCGGWGW